jgi:hypothetical protein
MKLRPDQVEALSQNQSRAFRQRLEEFAATRLHIPVTQETVDAFCARARGYGLRSERDYAGYISIALKAGVRPPDPDPDWIRTCLSDSTLYVPDRVRRLFAEAKRHLA